MTHTTGNILPVQISANIVLVLSKASVVISEAKTCSNLKKKMHSNVEHSSYSLTKRSDRLQVCFICLLCGFSSENGHSPDCQCTEWNISVSRHNPSNQLQKTDQRSETGLRLIGLNSDDSTRASHQSCSYTPHTVRVPQRGRTWRCHQVHPGAKAGPELLRCSPASQCRTQR